MYKELKKCREERRERAEKLFADHLLSQKTEVDKIKKSTTHFVLESKNFLNSIEVEKSDSENMQNFKAEVLKWSREISSLRHGLISVYEAEEKAKLGYMTQFEKALYKNFIDKKSRRDNLQKFLRR